ncbi:spermidine/putrescine transport system permease protein [Salirhabdus euzebyi]|uniref:Spermidine/putrescine transport system permease protein n=1 Tax=Salirhabdus euzebyi TaxID=394506 RepID=A0A841Q8J1_9BACI|nr:ABC transporter permease [Salirhabdus euzebyi]MBB6454716.1 spermidine/putrescine transport system permease protein [Salirhabdus euzebyi]
MIKNIRLAYSMLSPSLIWLLLFLIVPIVMVTVISFTTNEGYGGIIYEFSTEAYETAFLSSMYLKVIWNSIVWAFIATIICLFLAYPFAYFIAHAGKWKNLLILLVMIPFWTNLLVRLYAWIILLNGEGVINNFLMDLGLISDPLTLMYTPASVILGMVYGFLPFMILPIYSSIEQLDKTYLEAAEDLGANPMKTFFTVTLPLTFPGILAGFIITFVPAVSVFVVTDLLTGSKLVMVGNVIRDAFLIEMNWQLGSALSILLMVLVLLSVLVFMKFTSSKDKNFLV